VDDDDIYFTDVEETSMRFMRCDIAPLVLSLIEGIAGAIHATTVTAYNVAARHANFMHEQAVFHEEAAIEIETMTEGTDG
jgi:hypothetical protein